MVDLTTVPRIRNGHDYQRALARQKELRERFGAHGLTSLEQAELLDLRHQIEMFDAAIVLMSEPGFSDPQEQEHA